MTGTEPARSSWGIILAIWVAGLGAAAQYGKISVVFDRMPELYPQAGAMIGFTVSLVGVLGILLGVVAGLFVSSLGYRRTLVWSLIMGAAMSAVQMLHPGFSLFLITRVIEGLSHLGIVVAAPTLIAQVSSEQARGLAMTLWSTFFGVAFTLLAWGGLALVDSHGVLALFGAHAAVMAALALLLSIVLRDVPAPPRTLLPSLAALPTLHWDIYWSARKVAPAAGWLFYTCCFVAVLTVIPPHIDPDVRGTVLAAMPLASIAVSMTLGVYLLRWMTTVRLVQLGFGLCILVTLWLLLTPGHPLACVALAGAMGLVQGGSFAMVPQLNDSAADRAESSGAMAQAGNLGNTIGTPLMVLAIALAGYGGLMTTILILFLGGLLAHTALARMRRA